MLSSYTTEMSQEHAGCVPADALCSILPDAVLFWRRVSYNAVHNQFGVEYTLGVMRGAVQHERGVESLQLLLHHPCTN